ncbi:hypothetical protein [Actinopolyspora xinjiangensis]|uniref:hypothetical protein n=1 Tax=Actinopolyspora xinjiangensis TaxID=405564 RepID=UPI001FCD2326|nr:hypothetical protein [Actinopolyspora xinjiangensis]
MAMFLLLLFFGVEKWILWTIGVLTVVSLAAEVGREVMARSVESLKTDSFVSPDTLARAKNAVGALDGSVAHTASLYEFTEHALRGEVERLEAEHNGGSRFPKRDDESRTGSASKRSG